MIGRKLLPLLQKSKKSVLLLGPRQVGKSTILLLLKPDVEIQLAKESIYRDHLKDPALIERIVAGQSPNATIFVDEIQRLPFLLNTIQALIDQKSGRRFLLSGSSARKLRREQANLLPGRVIYHRLYPLTYWELSESSVGFDLHQVLKFGSLPEVVLSSEKASLLRSYVDIYLREEIQLEAATRDLAAFARFLDLSAELSGSVLNYSKISSDSEIPKETLRRYFQILQDSLLVHTLPGFTKIKTARKPAQKKKFILFDLGVRHAILNQIENQFSDSEMGRFFEEWLISQIIVFQNYASKPWKLYYYRDDGNIEADLIIQSVKKTALIDIKWSGRAHENDFQSLRKMADGIQGTKELILVYRGSHEQKFGKNEWALPLNSFLEKWVPHF